MLRIASIRLAPTTRAARAPRRGSIWILALPIAVLRLIAAAPGDLHAQGITEVTPFVTQVVDGSGDVGGGIAGIIGPDFQPQVAYYDETSKDLKYASLVKGLDPGFSPRWVIETVDGLTTDVGQYPSLALDAFSRPHISYYNATTGALMYATRPAAGAPWVVETVDDGGPANIGLHTSIAVSVSNQVGPPEIKIAYHDATNGLLKLATKPSGGTWATEVVDGGTMTVVGQYASLALDSENRPHIAYYDATNGNLKYAVKLGLTLPWTIEVADGLSLSLDVGQYTSIALRPAGPMISYYDVTNHDLKLATRLTTGWAPVTVDAAGEVGLATSLEIDAGTWEPRIAYYDLGNGDLRLASRSGTTWTIEAVAILGDNGRFNSLSLDALGNPIITFYDASNVDVKIADSSVRLHAPLGGEIWVPGSDQVVRWSGHGSVTIQVSVDGGTGFVDVSGLVSANAVTIRVPKQVTTSARVRVVRSAPYSVSESPGLITIAPGMSDRWSRVTVDGATSEVGGFTSLALDAAGSPRISYYTFDSYDLKYAAKLGATWAVETVDAAGDVGAYSSLALDASGNPKIAYYDYDNGNLKLASRSGATWTIEVVDAATADVGAYASLALDASGNPRIAYYDATNGDLKLATKSGSMWTIEVVDGLAADVGSYASLTGNRVGPPEIAYYDATNGDLKFAIKSGLTWTIEVVDGATADVGYYCSLASNPVASLVGNNVGPPEMPQIAYHDFTNNDLKFAYRVSPGVWSTQTVDAVGTTGRHTSIALDAEGRPHIAYRDVTNGRLKVAEAVMGLDPDFNPAGGLDPDFIVWHIETIDASGNVGAYTSLTLDPYQNLKLSYRDIANGDLKYASTAIEMGDPSMGTVWPVGASRTISWDGSGPVDISLSTDGGLTWDPVAEAVEIGLHKTGRLLKTAGAVNSGYRLIVPHAPTKFARIKLERAVPRSVSITPGLFTIETAISLLSMTALPAPAGGSGVVLSWRTDPGPEDLSGYRLERAALGSSDWRILVTLTRDTAFRDPGGGPGSKYRLFAVNGLGEELLVGETALRPPAPLLAWPLPYRGGDLKIAFATAGGLGGGTGRAEVALYDVRGRLVRRIVAGEYAAGFQSAAWDGRDDRGHRVAAGVYFLRSVSGGIERHTRVVVAR